ncbi:hypothetical protein QN397_14895 [Variovorax sp. RTB1]|uniref:hypothetical protein n=1 Tax=Variovorax sp. RTB1 TaxID=3048631 RepID=UPI002B22D468|nr:hypothetical protein [Variovorax sp. RTB1]MEB0112645.1 hypothetical protein [Variovorax sp. RTB1]
MPALPGFRLHASTFPNDGIRLLVPAAVKDQIDSDAEGLRLREAAELRQAEIVRDGRLRLARERTAYSGERDRRFRLIVTGRHAY